MEPDPKKILRVCVHSIQKARSNIAEIMEQDGVAMDDTIMADLYPNEWMFTDQCRQVASIWDKKAEGATNMDAYNALMFIMARGGEGLITQLAIEMGEAGYSEYVEDPGKLLTA